MREIIGAQGEITIIWIDRVPDSITTQPVETTDAGTIISHSESGHHHLLTGGDVLERTSDVRPGMRVLYAILDEPARLHQTAQSAHEPYDLPPGVYEFRCAREFDPFAEQARRVAD